MVKTENGRFQSIKALMCGGDIIKSYQQTKRPKHMVSIDFVYKTSTVKGQADQT